jgi:CDK inhibitor PHO81
LQFGKQLQAEVIPGWSEYYLDYKFLKKIVSSLAAKRPASEAAALALGIRPGHTTLSGPVSGAQEAVDIASQINEPSLIPTGQDDDRGPDFQAHKAAFFFKLERELEKVMPISYPSLSATDRRPVFPLCLDKRILPPKRS